DLRPGADDGWHRRDRTSRGRGVRLHGRGPPWLDSRRRRVGVDRHAPFAERGRGPPMTAANTEALPSPITRELISAGLRYIVREMRSTLIRSSYAPILFETHDFSCALCDVGDGQVVAMHVDVPMHIFPTIFTVRHMREIYGDDVNEGDIFFVNDPVVAGTH